MEGDDRKPEHSDDIVDDVLWAILHMHGGSREAPSLFAEALLGELRDEDNKRLRERAICFLLDILSKSRHRGSGGNAGGRRRRGYDEEGGGEGTGLGVGWGTGGVEGEVGGV